MERLIPEAWLESLPLPWLNTLVAALVAVALVLLVRWLAIKVLLRLTRSAVLPNQLVRRAISPSQWLLPLLVLQTVWSGAPDELPMITGVRHINGMLTIAAFTWLVLRLIKAVADTVELRNPLDIEDNLHARRIQTQVRVLVRCVNGLVVLFGVGLILVSFPPVRQIGTSLLASAGLAGLAAGFAAKPVLGNLIAGLQIAFTQPIRLDDVVIVEGEWGRIEEITGSYVIVKIWDERRLVVPLTYFIEKPFQNWTRSTSRLIGSVFLWVDYSVPLDPLREELKAACDAIPQLWDGRVCVLQVTDTSDKAMQIRILLSSADSSRNWDARCYVRERMINYINRHYPQSLPHLRAEIGQKPTPVPPTPDPAQVERQPQV